MVPPNAALGFLQSVNINQRTLRLNFSSDVSYIRADGRTDMTMPIAAFCNVEKAPKNWQGKIYHVGAINTYGGVKMLLHPFLGLVLGGGCGKFHVPAAVPPKEDHITPIEEAADSAPQPN